MNDYSIIKNRASQNENMDPSIMQPTTFYIPGKSLSWMYYSKRDSYYFSKSQI